MLVLLLSVHGGARSSDDLGKVVVARHKTAIKSSLT